MLRTFGKSSVDAHSVERTWAAAAACAAVACLTSPSLSLVRDRKMSAAALSDAVGSSELCFKLCATPGKDSATATRTRHDVSCAHTVNFSPATVSKSATTLKMAGADLSAFTRVESSIGFSTSVHQISTR